MCVANYGKVISIDEKTALVDFNGNRVSARTGLVEVKEGDYVLVHAGCILQKMNQKDMEEITELINEEEQAVRQLSI